jgi:hypothetical protein
MQGMAPNPQTFAGGLQGYSSGALFDQALAELQARRPGQVAQYNKMFVNPFSGSQPAPLAPPNDNSALLDSYAQRLGRIEGHVFTPR